MNVLAVGSHPDDLEIACFGTLARYAKAGHKVFACHVANGNQGHKVIMPYELSAIRAKEAEESAALIGAECISIDVDDLYINGYDMGTVKKLIEVVRYTKPDVIITHNPSDYMQDHMEAGRLAFNASFCSSTPHICEAVEAWDKVAPIFYMDTLAGVGFIPTEYVDITDTIELKLAALNKHESQIKWLADHDNIDFPDFVRTCSKYRGLQCGVPYAEGFRQCAAWPRFTTKRMLP